LTKRGPGLPRPMGWVSSNEEREREALALEFFKN